MRSDDLGLPSWEDGVRSEEGEVQGAVAAGRVAVAAGVQMRGGGSALWPAVCPFTTAANLQERT